MMGKRMRRAVTLMSGSDKAVVVASIIVVCWSISFSRYVGSTSRETVDNFDISKAESSQSSKKEIFNHNTKGYVVEGSVEVIDWPAHKGPFAAEMIQTKNVPVILRNTSINSWAAMKLWNPEYLSLKCRQEIPITLSPSPVFTYANPKRPMAQQASLRWQPPHSTERLSVSQFWKPRSQFSYLSAGAKDKLPEILADLQPLDLLIPQTQQSLHHPHILAEMERVGVKEGGGEQPDLNVWMGGKGVTAQTHYDWSFNFFAQIYGTKTFLLSPPSEFAKLKLFPSLHPSRRQSQVDFESSLDDNFQQIKAIQADLLPGDVLYLPPFWFHRVIATSTSISVNMWTGSPEEDLGDLLEMSSIPFEEDWTEDQKLAALVEFIQAMLKGVEEKRGLAEHSLLRYLIEESYVPALGKERRGVCRLVELERLRDFMKDLRQAGKIEQGAKKVVDLLNSSGRTEDARFELIVLEYCEKLIHFFVGLEDINHFVQNCLF